MDWFETILNGILLVGIVVGIVVERKSSKQINKRLDVHATQIDSAKRAATDAKLNSLDAKRIAKRAEDASTTVVVGNGLPDTPRNQSLVEALRTAAERQKSKRAHPAGTGEDRRVPGMGRSALTGRYRAPSSYTPAPDNTMLGVAAVIAATSVDSSSSSSYSDNSSSSSSSSSYDSGSSSSSSSDSGSFGGGDSGSF